MSPNPQGSREALSQLGIVRTPCLLYLLDKSTEGPDWEEAIANGEEGVSVSNVHFGVRLDASISFSLSHIY